MMEGREGGGGLEVLLSLLLCGSRAWLLGLVRRKALRVLEK